MYALPLTVSSSEMFFYYRRFQEPFRLNIHSVVKNLTKSLFTPLNYPMLKLRLQTIIIKNKITDTNQCKLKSVTKNNADG